MDKLIDNALTEEAKKNLEKKWKKVEIIKSEGNQLVKDGQYEKAIKKFDESLLLINEIILSTPISTPEMDIKNQKASIMNNIALCYAQMDVPSKVVEYCTLTIEIANKDEILGKAYNRRALAYEKLDKLVSALHDYEAVKNIYPGDKQAAEGLYRIH